MLREVTEGYRSPFEIRFGTTSQKAILTIGFLAVAFSVIAAGSHPASGYELSIYSGTPFLFWVLISFAVSLSIVTAFSFEGKYTRLSISLGTISILVIILLPTIRGYYFLGHADPLTNIGRTIDLLAGGVSPLDTKYSAVQILGGTIHVVTDMALNRSLSLIVPIFVLLYVLSIPLVTRTLATGGVVLKVGLFAAFLLLPISHLGGHFRVMATSQALMYAPLVLFLFLLLRRGTQVVPILLLLLTTSITFVLIHPQQAVNIIILMASFSISQYLLNGDSAEFRRHIFPTIAISIIVWLKINSGEVFREYFTGFVEKLLIGGASPAAQQIGRSTTLSNLGGSVLEIFVKLFIIDLLFSLLAGFVVLITLVYKYQILGYSRSFFNTIDTESVLSLALSVIPVGILFLAWIFVGTSDQYFRIYNFIMITTTVVGAIGLWFIYSEISRRWGCRRAQSTLIIILILGILITMPVYYKSPFIYKHTNHVPESEMVGARATINLESDRINHIRVSTSIDRYADAIEGETASSTRLASREPVADHFAEHRLPQLYDNPVYLIITETDRGKHIGIRRGLRFNSRDFRYLQEDPGINRIYTNSGFTLYLISD